MVVEQFFLSKAGTHLKISQPGARGVAGKGAHYLHFCSFICSLREGGGGEGMVFGLYLIKGEGAVKSSQCNVSRTRGRTIYRSLQYLLEGT